jgi:RNA polymerase sigma-70 factor
MSGVGAAIIPHQMTAPPAPDDTAFDRILRETHGLIRAHIAGMGVPICDVDDVAQEVYLDFATQMDRVPADVEVLRWLRGMARNCCHEYFRRRSRQSRHLGAIADHLVAQRAADSVEEEEDHQQRLDRLQACLERLGDHQRDLLVAYYRDGTPVPALAQARGKSVGAVHMMLSRLRDSLRRCLALRLPGGNGALS